MDAGLISLDPIAEREEIEADIVYRRKVTDCSAELIRNFAGPYYRQDWMPTSPHPENHYWEFQSNVVPQLVYNNPKVTYSSRRPVVQRELCRSMAAGVNRLASDIDLKRTLKLVAEDVLFDFGVILRTMAPMSGYSTWYGMRPLRPMLFRISPRAFFIDRDGSQPAEARRMGHYGIRDIEDLARSRTSDGRLRYNPDAIEKLVKEAGTKEARRELRLGQSLGGDEDRTGLRQDQVVVYHVYYPEHKLVRTYGSAGDRVIATELLREHRYRGYAKGPYTMFGLFAVPDQVLPLAYLAACAEQIEELNAHAVAASRAAAREKQIILIEAANKRLAKTVKEGRDGHVYRVNGLSANSVVQLDLGGTSVERYTYLALLRERVDRHTGLTETQRGNITGETATETELAQANADARMRFARAMFEWDTVDVLDGVGCDLFTFGSVRFPMPYEVDGTEYDATFVGGLWPGQEDWVYEDLELTIEPMSMGHTAELAQMKRMDDTVMAVNEFAGMVMTNPIINVRDLADDWGTSRNIHDMSKYIDYEMAAILRQGIMAMPSPVVDPNHAGTIQAFGMTEQAKRLFGAGIGAQRQGRPGAGPAGPGAGGPAKPSPMQRMLPAAQASQGKPKGKRQPMGAAA